MRRPTHEELLEGKVNTVSWINEPVDYTIDYAVKIESALEIAQQRWRHAELISGDRSERPEA